MSVGAVTAEYQRNGWSVDSLLVLLVEQLRDVAPRGKSDLYYSVLFAITSLLSDESSLSSEDTDFLLLHITEVLNDDGWDDGG